MKKVIPLLATTVLVLSLNGQTITELFLPEYLANGNTTGDRAPTAARLTITGLLPNATYRYYVSGETNVPVGTGAGNYFGINNTANAAGYIQGYTTKRAWPARSWPGMKSSRPTATRNSPPMPPAPTRAGSRLCPLPMRGSPWATACGLG